jgi:hypothetical protein
MLSQIECLHQRWRKFMRSNSACVSFGLVENIFRHITCPCRAKDAAMALISAVSNTPAWRETNMLLGL